MQKPPKTRPQKDILSRATRSAITLRTAKAQPDAAKSSLGRSKRSEITPARGPSIIGPSLAAVKRATENSERVVSNTSQPSTSVCVQRPPKKKRLDIQSLRYPG
ncbi:hypothetical protein D9M72_515050 [compost metagenome]